MRRAGFLLGFALGGFFDGILLHQVLQWHHLLSGLEGARFRELQVQILADGLFHLLMYLLALIGLSMLWKSRRDFAAPSSGRMLIAQAFIGFGTWHVLDGVLSHWVLGIHRIRMDSANPLLWDLVWFVLFGVLFLVVGWRFLRRMDDRSPPEAPRLHRSGHHSTPLMLAALTLIAGLIAALPPRDGTTVLVIFRPGVTSGQIFDGIAAAGGGIVWADRRGALWALRLREDANAAVLYEHGALLVSRSSFLAGCLAWSRAEPQG